MPRKEASALAAASSSRSTRRGVSASSDGPLDPVEAGGQPGDDEQHPELRVRQEAVEEQHPGRGHHPELAQEHHAAAVDRIGERAADEGHDEDRHELGEGDQADRERGAGELERLEGHGHERDHRPEKRDRLAEEEQPEVSVPPQRAEVDDGEAGEPSQTARLRLAG